MNKRVGIMDLESFFPVADVYGYQGFTNLPQLMNTIPADFEEKFKVIPKKIIVSGRV